MDKTVVTEKLDSLYRCIKRVEEKRPLTESVLREDYDLQDIIAVNLIRAVQLAVDIGTHAIALTSEKAPSSMAEVFPILVKLGVISPTTANSMKSAVGFRNVSVHVYDAIDWAIVYAIITKHLDDFRVFAREINDYLKL